MTLPVTERSWQTNRRVDLHIQLGPLRRGIGDPTWHTAADGAVWRTTRTPDGAGVERLAVDASAGAIAQQTWGPGAHWLTERLPVLLGAADDPAGFVAPPQLSATAKRYQNWRAGRTNRVLEALIAAILEQKVTGKEAWLGWRTLICEFGEPAPGGGTTASNLRVFPSADVWCDIPSWAWHKAAVDSKRSASILRVASQEPAIESLVDAKRSDVNRRLRAIPGVGIWTVAETVQRSLGDADAVSYGDFHVAHNIVHTLTGERNGSDQQLAELLLPYVGHRYRIQRLVELARSRQPRHGPRATVQDMRNF